MGRKSQSMLKQGDSVELREDFTTWAKTTYPKGFQGTVKSIDNERQTAMLEECMFYDIPLDILNLAASKPEKKRGKRKS